MNSYLQWDMFKGPYGKFMVYAGKATEFITGILLSLGLLTRVCAILMIGNFSYITFFVGQGRFWYEDQHPFMFALFGILFLFTGPGAWSLDGIIFNKKGWILRCAEDQRLGYHKVPWNFPVNPLQRLSGRHVETWVYNQYYDAIRNLSRYCLSLALWFQWSHECYALRGQVWWGHLAFPCSFRNNAFLPKKWRKGNGSSWTEL